MYRRVIPRDLFNEANLLKCLGQLYLLTENNPKIRLTHNDKPFEIRQDYNDGSIFVSNIHIVINERLFDHRRPLNSREPWPLYITRSFDEDSEDIPVFDELGALSQEFKMELL